ncbi:MAG: HAMP domain-containing histidine kinase [Bacteroidales bacterium]|nr:HAMP domain-containing histidine kinase [Bacteroidales bacterium]
MEKIKEHLFFALAIVVCITCLIDLLHIQEYANDHVDNIILLCILVPLILLAYFDIFSHVVSNYILIIVLAIDFFILPIINYNHPHILWGFSRITMFVSLLTLYASYSLSTRFAFIIPSISLCSYLIVMVLSEKLELEASLTQTVAVHFVLSFACYFLLENYFNVITKKDNSVKYIKKLNAELKMKSVDLERALLHQTRVFEIISHDLKTPFQSIIGFMDLLKENLEMDIQSAQYFEHLDESIHVTHDMLNDLISWGQCKKQHVELSEFNIVNCIYEVINNIKGKARLKNVEIRLQFEVARSQKLNADIRMIQTVLRNLICNSIKFCKQDGLISLIVTKELHHIRFNILDNGIGINDYKQFNENLKQTTIHSTRGTDGENGSGIGLKICKDLIEIHDGRLEAFPNRNSTSGACFTFVIPIRKALKNSNRSLHKTVGDNDQVSLELIN